MLAFGACLLSVSATQNEQKYREEAEKRTQRTPKALIEPDFYVLIRFYAVLLT